MVHRAQQTLYESGGVNLRLKLWLENKIPHPEVLSSDTYASSYFLDSVKSSQSQTFYLHKHIYVFPPK